MLGFKIQWLQHLCKFKAQEKFAYKMHWLQGLQQHLAAELEQALPLVLVSLSGQFLPGMAILRASGYDTPARPLIVTTSLASVAVACFGGINIVIAAITAAMCTGRDAHEDPARRYVAGIANGVFYLVGGTLAGSIVLLVTLLPPVLVAMLAGSARSAPATTSQPIRSLQVCSCFTAAARNVSAAASTTFLFSRTKWRASLAMLVVLPTPFLPSSTVI